MTRLSVLTLFLAALFVAVVSADDPLTIRTHVDKKSLELTVMHSVDADTAVLHALMESEFISRVSSVELGSRCSMQHIVTWRRPPAGDYVIVVWVVDSTGRTIQSGMTRLFVS